MLLGLALTFWTDKSINVFAIFGIYLAAQRHLPGGAVVLVGHAPPAPLAISGIPSIIPAAFMFKAVHNDLPAEILALFIGIAWLFRGIVEPYHVGLQSKGVDGSGWLITGGILLILGAVVIWRISAAW